MRGNKIIKAYLNARGLGEMANVHDNRAQRYIIDYICVVWMQNYLDAIIGQRQKRKQMHSLVWKAPFYRPPLLQWAIDIGNAKHTQMHRKLTYEIAFWANNWIFGVICKMHLVANWILVAIAVATRHRQHATCCSPAATPTLTSHFDVSLFYMHWENRGFRISHSRKWTINKEENLSE